MVLQDQRAHDKEEVGWPNQNRRETGYPPPSCPEEGLYFAIGCF